LRVIGGPGRAADPRLDGGRGAAITWAANHLKHHAYADEPGDPHSLAEGLFHAHLGWLFGSGDADPERYCQHLLNDPVVVFVGRSTCRSVSRHTWDCSAR
jgi:fatty-acid desaturase